MACDPQTLIAGAKCFECFSSGAYDRLFDAVEVALLCAIVDGDTSMACNPQSLISQANCLFCNIPDGMMQSVKLYLLCQIAANGGGGGGGGTIQVYEGAFTDPNGNVTPDDPTKPALYFTNGGGTLWQWDVPSQTWV